MATPLIERSQDYKKTVLSTAVVIAAQNILALNANPWRKGLTIYNNSTNSLYVGIESDVSGGNQIAQLGSNATIDAYKDWYGPVVWTGAIWIRRNAGTGNVIIYEFL